MIHGGTSRDYESRHGVKRVVIEEEMCNELWDLVYCDRRVKVEEIAKT